MAIQTRGFDVGVLPQFSGVDPRLVTIDPNNAVRGIMQSLQIADTMNKLKAFKEAELFLAQVRPSQAQAAIAQNDKIAALSPLETFAGQQTIPALAQAEVAEANKRSVVAPLQANAFARTVGPQTDLTLADLSNRMGEIDISNATQPFRRTAAVIGAQGAAERAPTQEELNKVAQEVEVIKSKSAPWLTNLQLQNSIRELTAELNAPTSAAELNRKRLNVDMSLKEAQTQELLDRNDTKLAIAAERNKAQAEKANSYVVQHKMASDDLNNATARANRWANMPIVDPENPEIKTTLSQAFDKVMTLDGNGKWVQKQGGFPFFRKALELSPATKQAWENYSREMDNVTEAQMDMSDLRRRHKAIVSPQQTEPQGASERFKIVEVK